MLGPPAPLDFDNALTTRQRQGRTALWYVQGDSQTAGVERVLLTLCVQILGCSR